MQAKVLAAAIAFALSAATMASADSTRETPSPAPAPAPGPVTLSGAQQKIDAGDYRSAIPMLTVIVKADPDNAELDIIDVGGERRLRLGGDFHQPAIFIPPTSESRGFPRTRRGAGRGECKSLHRHGDSPLRAPASRPVPEAAGAVDAIARSRPGVHELRSSAPRAPRSELRGRGRLYSRVPEVSNSKAFTACGQRK